MPATLMKRCAILAAPLLLMIGSAFAAETVVQAFAVNTGQDYQLKIARHAAPDYPRAALEREQGGYVDIQFTVSADGKVEEVRIIGAEPKRVFERTSLRAAKKWRFSAPSDDGQSTSQTAVYRFQFAIE